MRAARRKRPRAFSHACVSGTHCGSKRPARRYGNSSSSAFDAKNPSIDLIAIEDPSVRGRPAHPYSKPKDPTVIVSYGERGGTPKHVVAAGAGFPYSYRSAATGSTLAASERTFRE